MPKALGHVKTTVKGCIWHDACVCAFNWEMKLELKQLKQIKAIYNGDLD